MQIIFDSRKTFQQTAAKRRHRNRTGARKFSWRVVQTLLDSFSYPLPFLLSYTPCLFSLSFPPLRVMGGEAQPSPTPARLVDLTHFFCSRYHTHTHIYRCNLDSSPRVLQGDRGKQHSEHWETSCKNLHIVNLDHRSRR